MRISDWSSDVCSSDLQHGTKAAFSADPYRLGHASPIGPELAEIGYHDQPVEHCDDKQGDKSHRRWNRQIFSRSPARDDHAHHGKRNVDKDEDRTSTRLNSHNYCASRMQSSP